MTLKGRCHAVVNISGASIEHNIHAAHYCRHNSSKDGVHCEQDKTALHPPAESNVGSACTNRKMGLFPQSHSWTMRIERTLAEQNTLPATVSREKYENLQNGELGKA